MSWPAPTFTDGAATTPKRCSMPVLSAPIPGVNLSYHLTEEWMQLLTATTDWAPAALNAAHGDYSDYYLVEESPLRDAGGGWVRWTKKFSKVPAQHNEWETYAYQFPGMVNVAGIGVPVVQGRDPFSWVVTSRVQHDYFLVNPALSVDAPPIYKLPGNIPMVEAFLYINQATYLGTAYGGMYLPTRMIFDYTLPTTTQYQAMIYDAFVNGWASTVSVQNWTTNSTTHNITMNPTTGGSPTVFGGQIVAENSRLVRFSGNVWLRQTRYVLAI